MRYFRRAGNQLQLLTGLLLATWLAAGLSACASHPRDGAPDGSFDHTRIADPVPRDEPRSRYGNPSDYVVFGKTYHVMSDAEAKGFTQEGLASWYGTKFHGRRTSSGEPYDMYKMTAAHKELPLPSYVRVENINNGRSIIVRVNDRGPFHDGRIIDLSYAAALKLDVVSTGTAPVRIVVLDPAGSGSSIATAEPDTSRDVSPPESPGSPGLSIPPVPAEASPTHPAQGGDWFVQLAAFSTEDNAMAFKIRLEISGLRPVQIAPDETSGIFRVRLGPYEDESAANEQAMRLAALGISEFHVRQD